MEKIKDLGMRYPTKTSKSKTRFWVVKCPICKELSEMTIQSIRRGAKQCKVCADKNRKMPTNKGLGRKKYSTQDFIYKSTQVHGKYSYTKTVYRGSSENVTITCPTHGDFRQRAGQHLRGSGCKRCIVYTKSDEDCVYVWQLEIDGVLTDYYKIGITSKRLKLARIDVVSKKASLAFKVDVKPKNIILKETSSAKETESLLLSLFPRWDSDKVFTGSDEVCELSLDDINKVKVFISLV